MDGERTESEGLSTSHKLPYYQPVLDKVVCWGQLVVDEQASISS